ncbi:MAG: membrane protein insertase YidC [Acidimicrobiia bacterium]|nr:membrane protein insertase YidC [Acidimicrobiia bacterium]
MFQAAAWLISQFYSLTSNYIFAIAIVAFVIMMLIFPLTLKSTKGMLEMQRVQPEMRRIQQQYRNDRQKMNEEMMKLYQEHKVNPLASCLPLLAQMPIFIIMFRVLHGLTSRGSDGTFDPDYISKSSELYSSLDNKTEMLTWGLDLSLRPIEVLQDDPGKGVVYALLVVALMGLYYAQQRMIASRTVSPTMSATQAKIMQYLPVVFGVFQIFFPVGLVIYYFSQTIVRIAQQAYITRRFYKGDESLGRQAQAASAKARDMAKKDGGGGGLFGQLKQEAAKAKQEQASNRPTSKRVTPPKGSASAKGGSSGTKGRPTPSNRPKPGGKPRHPKPPRP